MCSAIPQPRKESEKVVLKSEQQETHIGYLTTEKGDLGLFEGAVLWMGYFKPRAQLLRAVMQAILLSPWGSVEGCLCVCVEGTLGWPNFSASVICFTFSAASSPGTTQAGRDQAGSSGTVGSWRCSPVLGPPERRAVMPRPGWPGCWAGLSGWAQEGQSGSFGVRHDPSCLLGCLGLKDSVQSPLKEI